MNVQRVFTTATKERRPAQIQEGRTGVDVNQVTAETANHVRTSMSVLQPAAINVASMHNAQTHQERTNVSVKSGSRVTAFIATTSTNVHPVAPVH